MKLLCFFLCVALVGCSFPKDANNSWQQAKQQALQIGLVSTSQTDSDSLNAHPRELAMLMEFAKKNALPTNVTRGSESELVALLKDDKIHIIAGHFKKNTVWAKHAALSRPYDKEHVFLLPKGESKLLFELETYLYTLQP